MCVFVGVRHQIKSSNFGIIILNCARLENAIIVCPENKSKEILKQNSKLSKFFEANKGLVILSVVSSENFKKVKELKAENDSMSSIVLVFKWIQVSSKKT